eukprot:2985240-Lingulodinium_polyedra.AAC.1
MAVARRYHAGSTPVPRQSRAGLAPVPCRFPAGIAPVSPNFPAQGDPMLATSAIVGARRSRRCWRPTRSCSGSGTRPVDDGLSVYGCLSTCFWMAGSMGNAIFEGRQRKKMPRVGGGSCAS